MGETGDTGRTANRCSKCWKPALTSFFTGEVVALTWQEKSEPFRTLKRLGYHVYSSIGENPVAQNFERLGYNTYSKVA